MASREQSVSVLSAANNHGDLAFNRRGKVERWLDELWTWLLRFNDSVFAIALKPGSVGTRLHALKFLETYVMLFTAEPDNSELPVNEGRRHMFNISWLVGSHPFLDSVMLRADANGTVGIFLNFLRSSGSLPGSLTIAVVNCVCLLFPCWRSSMGNV